MNAKLTINYAMWLAQKGQINNAQFGGGEVCKDQLEFDKLVGKKNK